MILMFASRFWQQTNVIDNNVKCVLPHIPDNVQGGAELVLACLPKSSNVHFVTDIFKENSIKFFGRKQLVLLKILLI